MHDEGAADHQGCPDGAEAAVGCGCQVSQWRRVLATDTLRGGGVLEGFRT